MFVADKWVFNKGACHSEQQAVHSLVLPFHCHHMFVQHEYKLITIAFYYSCNSNGTMSLKVEYVSIIEMLQTHLILYF